jgi:hypothetical protein
MTKLDFSEMDNTPQQIVFRLEFRVSESEIRPVEVDSANCSGLEDNYTVCCDLKVGHNFNMPRSMIEDLNLNRKQTFSKRRAQRLPALMFSRRISKPPMRTRSAGLRPPYQREGKRWNESKFCKRTPLGLDDLCT